jgi:hypothetical protein
MLQIETPPLFPAFQPRAGMRNDVGVLRLGEADGKSDGSDVADLSDGSAPGAGLVSGPRANSSQLIFIVVLVAMHFSGHGFEAAE